MDFVGLLGDLFRSISTLTILAHSKVDRCIKDVITEQLIQASNLFTEARDYFAQFHHIHGFNRFIGDAIHLSRKINDFLVDHWETNHTMAECSASLGILRDVIRSDVVTFAYETSTRHPIYHLTDPRLTRDNIFDIKWLTVDEKNAILRMPTEPSTGSWDLIHKPEFAVHDWFVAQSWETFLLGTHPRVGKCSPIRILCEDVFSIIGCCLFD